MNTPNARIARLLLAMALGAVSTTALVACGGGGGGGGGDSSGSPTASIGIISGTATKGPVSGATVRAFAISNDAKGGQLGSAQTDASGNFTMRVDAYSGPMMLQLHGGSYMDEATGTRMNMLDADDMTCVVPSISVTAGSATTGIQITPLTSMAHAWAEHMAGGMTATNITTANMRVGAAYMGPGMDILMTHPIDPTVTGSANGASIDAKNYGMMLAAMSQEAHQLGMTTSSSAMITAMHNDAEDGTMDGTMSGTPINMNGMGGMMGGGSMMSAAGTGELATAMATFINSPMNRSGVISIAEMQPLMDQLHQLHNSGGHL
jgi:hypothetical protein